MLTKEQIELLDAICSYDRNWTLNELGEVDVLERMGFTTYIQEYKQLFAGGKINIKFGKFLAEFDCNRKQLTSLENCPKYCAGFNCSHNLLTSLEHSPKSVGYHYSCYHNLLTSLYGAPEICYGGFSCQYNFLTSLEWAPKKVGEAFVCSYNRLTNLIGAPEMSTFCGSFACDSNQLTSLEGCPQFVKFDFDCRNNPKLEYLWCIGQVKGRIFYDNHNEINDWIVKHSISIKNSIEYVKYIEYTQNYQGLINAPEEIRQHFSPAILYIADNKIL